VALSAAPRSGRFPALKPLALSAETDRAMLDPGTELTLPWPMAFAVVLGSITLAVYFSRAYARRERRKFRQQARDLARDLSGFLDGRLSAQQIREAVNDMAAGAFWTAIEAYAVRLPQAEWFTLSKALERSPHVSGERQALRDDSPWRGELAARRLALVRSRASRRALRRAMVQGPEMLSYACARALGRFGDQPALRWLLKHPQRLSRRSTRQWLSVLKTFGPGAFPHMTELLPQLKDAPIVERAVVEAFGHLGDLAAASMVEARLTHQNPETRVAAARALGRMRAVTSASSLIKALKDDAWQVRAQAAWALGRARAPIAIYPLTSRLTDRAWWVRRHAAYALAEMGEDGRAALEHAIETSDDPYAREMAREALDGGALKPAA
jgi:HEAT repeat protein